MSDFGDALKRLMAIRGLGVNALARQSHYSAGHISNLRTGSKQASQECAAELDDILGAGGELVALVPRGERRAADVVTRTTPKPANVGSFTPADDVSPVEHFRKLREMLSESDNLFGPRHLVPVVTEQITLIQQLRHGRDGADSRELLTIQARYAETLAWLYQDTADFRSAQYWLDRALEWSHMSADGIWTAFVLARKSQLAGDMHDPASAVDLAEAAARAAAGATRLRAAGATYKAHGLALASDATACLNTLDQAHDYVSAPEDQPDAPWDGWLSPGYVEIQRARCLTILGDYAEAAVVFSDAINGIPPTLRRDRGVYLAREAIAHAEAGQPDLAASAGMRALTIVELTQSGRIVIELRRLDAALKRWQMIPAAADFREALGLVIAPLIQRRQPRHA